MGKKKHNKDKKLHNSDEKLHNSEGPDLSWQENVNLLPEDEVEGGSEIYYLTDEDGNVHSREFLPEELILDEKETEDAIKRNSSYVGRSCVPLRIRRCCSRHSRGIVHLFSDRQMPLSSQTIDIAHSIVNGDGRVRCGGTLTPAQLDWIHTYGDCAVFLLESTILL